MNNTDETIYNLPNQSPQCSSTNPKHYYRSIFAPDVLYNLNKNKYSHRTMGPAVISKPDPSRPLRRGEKYVELPKITRFIRSHRMPPIPKVTEQNKNKSEPSKNFIQENKNQIINSSPLCPRRYIVSDRKGNKFLIDGSGLQKDFIYKKNYGRIPLYLRTRKTVDEPLTCDAKNNSTTLLPPEERLCLIHNLKIRYANVLAEYQRLPLRLETASTILKETHLTNELIDIERDINFLEKYQQIFIVNNYSDINT